MTWAFAALAARTRQAIKNEQRIMFGPAGLYCERLARPEAPCASRSHFKNAVFLPCAPCAPARTRRIQHSLDPLLNPSLGAHYEPLRTSAGLRTAAVGQDSIS